MCQAAPGRFALGIGTSSDVIVEQWNGIPFEKPYQRVRDTIRFLRAALAARRSPRSTRRSPCGFRLGVTLPELPPILVAALRPGMLKLAGREGDGAIINWLSADDVKTVVPYVGEGKEIVARIFVLPTTDRDLVRLVGRRAIAAYLNVPVYAKFHEWLGRGEMLQPMWDAWKAGDRAAATEAIPDSLLDEIIVHGSTDEIREHLARFAANGVTTPAPAILGSGEAVREVVRALAPNGQRRRGVLPSAAGRSGAVRTGAKDARGAPQAALLWRTSTSRSAASTRTMAHQPGSGSNQWRAKRADVGAA